MLIYLPLNPEMAKKENLPLKLPVLPEDVEIIKKANKIPLEVILKGLRKQFAVSPDEYYTSYLIYFIYEDFKIRTQNKDFKSASTLLEEIREIGSVDFRYFFYSGILSKNLGFFGEAEKEMRKALSMTKGNPLIAFEIGRLLDETGNYDEALEFYTRTLEIDSRFIPAYMAAADIFFRAKDYSSAQNLYLRCIELGEDFLPPYSRLGVIYNTEHRYDKAYEILIKALKKFPDDKELNYNLSFTCLRMRKPFAAINYLKKCVEIDTKFVPGWNELALLQKNYGFYGEAFDSITQALKLDDESEGVLWNYFRIAVMASEHEKALSVLEKIKAIDSSEKKDIIQEVVEDKEYRYENTYFSIEKFSFWALNAYKGIPGDIKNVLNNLEDGFLVYKEIDASGDLRYKEFFTDIVDEYISYKIELERALTVFSVACTGSTKWLAFSKAFLSLCFEKLNNYEYSEYGFNDFNSLIEMLVEETRDIDWDFSREISNFDYENLRDLDQILENWKHPCTLTEYLFIILELLRIDLNEEEKGIIEKYDETLYTILQKIKSR